MWKKWATHASLSSLIVGQHSILGQHMPLIVGPQLNHRSPASLGISNLGQYIKVGNMIVGNIVGNI